MTGNGKTATSTIIVNKDVESVSISGYSSPLDVEGINGDKTVKLTATLSPNDANINNENVTWKSDNTSIAEVNASTGLVTAKGKGKATITATTQNGKTAQCSVVVTRSITSLSLSPKSKILSVGESVTLTYTQTPSKDVSSETISWSSSNNNVATVNNGVVTAKAVGTATITIKSSSGKASDTATINVVYSSSQIDSTFYGSLVTNYHGSDDNNMKYRIFYADGSNVYLIADDYIHYTKAPQVDVYNSDTGSYSKAYLQHWYGDYRLGLEFSNSQGEIYAPYSADYLKNQDKWASLYKGTFADYVQGASTLEMYLSSYNQTHGTSIAATKDGGTNINIYLNSDHVTKYEIPTQEDYNGIYLKLDKSKAYGMFLATAGSEGYMWTVGTFLEFNKEKVGFDLQIPSGNYRTGIRPIICLNSSVKFQRNSDTSEESYTLFY